MTTEEWPWDQAPNVATVSCGAVILRGAPVLLVVHYSEDDSWAFLDGGEFSLKDALLVSMAEAVKRDPSLRQVANLPPGWVARRQAVGGEWTREPDPDV